MAGAKIKIKQAVVVEGKYDKIKLESLVDGMILATDGFRIFKDKEMQALVRGLAKTCGVVILTDSDAAGFKIRALLSSITAGEVINVYAPDILGKERRKQKPSAEGKLGVEGMDVQILRDAFERAGVAAEPARPHANPVTRADLYEAGFVGGADSRALRYALYDRLSLPRRLNSTAALPLINTLLTREEFERLAGELRDAMSSS
jgi:ribonuclease M5